MENILIREMKNEDWDQISIIYIQGIQTNLATFQTECPEFEQWDSSHIKKCRYVITLDDKVAGWAALSPVSSREVYKGVAEISIYIDENYKNMKLGEKLLNYLVENAFKNGFWTLQSSVIANNTASLRLHEKCGFRIIGYREHIARDRFGSWRDTVLLEYRKKD